jgi:hypothetical protein
LLNKVALRNKKSFWQVLGVRSDQIGFYSAAITKNYNIFAPQFENL